MRGKAGEEKGGNRRDGWAWCVGGGYWCLLLVTSGGIRPEREPKSDAGADFGSGNGSKKKRWEKGGNKKKRGGKGRWSREYSPGNVAGVSASLPGHPRMS